MHILNVKKKKSPERIVEIKNLILKEKAKKEQEDKAKKELEEKLKKESLKTKSTSQQSSTTTKKSQTLQIIDPQEFYYNPYTELTYIEDTAEDSIQWKEKGGEEKEKSIEAATLNRLVAELTSSTYFDPHFLHTFMITYRSFSDRDTIFSMLIERYSLKPKKENFSNEEFSKWKMDVLDKVRLRIVQTIKYWIENFFFLDFDEDFIKKAKDFIDLLNKLKGDKKENPHATIIIRALEKVAQEAGTGVKQSDVKYPPIIKPPKGLFIKRKKKEF